jgi:hypothetical protein
MIISRPLRLRPQSSVRRNVSVSIESSSQRFDGKPLCLCTTHVQFLEILLSKKLGRGGFSLPLEGD